MQIRMRTTAAGPMGAFNAGQVYDMPAEIAQIFIKAGAAEVVDMPAQAAPVVETEVQVSQLTAEKALSPRGKKK